MPGGVRLPPPPRLQPHPHGRGRPRVRVPSHLEDLSTVLRAAARLATASARIVARDSPASKMAASAASSFSRPDLPRLSRALKENPRTSPDAVLHKAAMTVDNLTVFSRAMARVAAAGLAEETRKHIPKEQGELRAKDSTVDPSAAVEYVLDRETSSMDMLEKADLMDRNSVRKVAFKAVKKESKTSQGTEEDAASSTVDSTDVEEEDVSKLEWRTEKKLSSSSTESAVPSSRLGRIASFGTLGVGLGLGTVAEYSRRMLGVSSPESTSGPALLSDANAERIVATLCRVRGAALKIGQMLSIQDDALLNPQLARIFERVRESADFMPVWQFEGALSSELGPDWRTKFSKFEDRPFAAASIGQVHAGVLAADGTPVAVKIQYPGVARGIDSDIDNLLVVLEYTRLVPPGIFLDVVVKHMKVELAQECDYAREAECCRRFARLVADWPDLYVPRVVDELSTSKVLTTEMIKGLTIDQCAEQTDQRTRNHITELILRLLLRELFVYRYMQTDPNWANFLYNPDTGKLGLLDFGATREFRPFFVDNYFRIIDSAARGDRDGILEHSRTCGFLTGRESRAMNEAHVESVMILGECFREDRDFDFGRQKTTQRMQELVPVMMRERLCPPPPEVYSLHRKMSGLFLLASKLRAVINCHPVWNDIREEFREASATSASASADSK